MSEFLGVVFDYPNRSVAEALSDGRLLSDCISCCIDCGVDRGSISEFENDLHGFGGTDADRLVEEMRRDYSQLFLGPGLKALVLPYESAYLHILQGKRGTPTLFRSALTLDVENRMREAGMMLEGVRKEPCDSIFYEFRFLSYLYGNLARAIQQGDGEYIQLLLNRIEQFVDDHALQWMPSFMTRTAELSCGLYGLFARVALAFFAVDSRSVVRY